jgi:hypothetical protein
MRTEKARLVIASHLGQGEHLVWYGRPNPWYFLGLSGLLALVVVFVIVAMPIYGPLIDLALSSPKAGSSIEYPHFTVLIFLSLPFFLWLAAIITPGYRIFYGLTNSRLLVIRGFFRRLYSYDHDAFHNMLRDGGSTRGTIRFCFVEYNSANAHLFLERTDHSRYDLEYAAALVGISNPIDVEARIYETLVNKKSETCNREIIQASDIAPCRTDGMYHNIARQLHPSEHLIWWDRSYTPRSVFGLTNHRFVVAFDTGQTLSLGPRALREIKCKGAAHDGTLILGPEERLYGIRNPHHIVDLVRKVLQP